VLTKFDNELNHLIKEPFVLIPAQASLEIIDMKTFSCAPSTRKALPRIQKVIKQIIIIPNENMKKQ